MPQFFANLNGAQWAAIALLVLVALRNRDLFAGALSRVKGLVKTVAPATTPATSDVNPTAEQAFHAVNVLLAHFEATKCEAGLAAARTAGAHLFDKPGEHAA